MPDEATTIGGSKPSPSFVLHHSGRGVRAIPDSPPGAADVCRSGGPS